MRKRKMGNKESKENTQIAIEPAEIKMQEESNNIKLYKSMEGNELYNFMKKVEEVVSKLEFLKRSKV